MKRKILVLFFIVIASLICTTMFIGCDGSADSNDSMFGNFSYDERDDYCSIYLDCPRGKVVIPSHVNGKPVTRIITAFADLSNLTSLIIPNSVVSIDGRVFKDATNLQYNEYDNGLYLGNADNPYVAFIKPKTNDITSCLIHDDTVTISSSAFEDCDSLTNIEISNGIKYIDSYVFCNCSSLMSITIGNGVTSISNNAFRGCGGLDIYYTGDIASWCEIQGLVEIMPCTHLYINGNEIKDNIVIPNSVTSIGNYAFRGCDGLKSVTIGNGVTNVGWGAFSGCSSLTSIEIPNSVTSISGDAFKDCSSLTNVTYIGDIKGWCEINGLSELMKYGKSNKTLNIDGKNITGTLVIPNSVTYIASYAFSYCSSLTSIEIPNNVYIGMNAFYDTAYYKDESNWEDGVLNIGKHLIKAKNTISEVYTIKQGTLTVASSAFSNCSSLTSIEIPNSVTSIGNSAFSNCSSLTSVKIPNSVTSIGSYLFRNCSSLTSIEIPNSVTSIWSRVFEGCSSLTSIVFNGTMAQWKEISKDSYWNYFTDNYTVTCTDGTLSKSES